MGDGPPADTEAAIMDATRRALADHGHADLSMAKIAAGFEGSQSLLHYHYDTKDGLLAAFVAHERERVAGEFAALPADPAERLDALLDRLVDDVAAGGATSPGRPADPEESPGAAAGEATTGESPGEAAGDATPEKPSSEMTGDATAGKPSSEMTGDATPEESSGEAAGDATAGKPSGEAAGGTAVYAELHARAPHSDALREELVAFEDLLFDAVRDAVADCVAAGVLAPVDPDRAATLVVAAHDSAFVGSLLGVDRDLRAAVERFALSGWDP